MFKITTDPKFTHPVTVCVPVDGGFKDQTFPVTFRALPLDQLGDKNGNEGQIETLRKVVVHMGELVDDNDQPISYSDEIRDQLIQFGYVRLALLKTYIEAMSKMKTGN
jgi:hypothetical protein